MILGFGAWLGVWTRKHAWLVGRSGLGRVCRTWPWPLLNPRGSLVRSRHHAEAIEVVFDPKIMRYRTLSASYASLTLRWPHADLGRGVADHPWAPCGVCALIAVIC